MTARGLAKLIEECGELTQVAGKKLAYYHTDVHPDTAGSLKVRLENEMADVMAAITFTATTLGLDRARIQARWQEKATLFFSWHADPDNNRDGVDR